MKVLIRVTDTKVVEKRFVLENAEQLGVPKGALKLDRVKEITE